MTLTNPSPVMTAYIAIGNANGAEPLFVQINPQTSVTLTLSPLQAAEFENMRRGITNLGVTIR